MTEIPPGWYPDPIEPEITRYWDGEQWRTDGPDSAIANPVEAQAALEPEPAPDAGTAEAPPEPDLPVYQVAPLGTRLAARLVDIGLVGLLILIVNSYFLWQYWQELQPVLSTIWKAAQAGQDPPNVEVPERANRLNLIITVVSLLLWGAYEVPALARNGQTPGKRLLGIQVKRLDGESPGFATAFRRWMWLALPMLLCPCGLPFQLFIVAWALWDRPLFQGLHDKLARTIVVRSKPTEIHDAPHPT